MKQFPLKMNPHIATMLFQNGQMIATTTTPSHAIEIMRRFNSHEAAQRLAEAATAVMIDAAHMQHNDAYVISAEVYNRLTAALAEWEAVK